MTVPAARILVIEDNALLRAQLQHLFTDAGMTVEFASDGLSGLQMALDAPPDVLVLDVGLPALDGLRLCERLRAQADRHVPVLMLTARDALEDKLQGFRAGADDYLVKPFSVGELMARVRVALRRMARSAEAAAPLRFGDCQLDLARRLVTRSGEPVHLTPVEYRLLAQLAAHEGQVLTHRQLLREVWGPNSVEHGHYLRIYMGHLRRKLETDPARPQHLLTETGVGYRFIVDPPQAGAPSSG